MRKKQFYLLFILLIVFLMNSAPALLSQENVKIHGIWQGTLAVSGMELRILFKVEGQSPDSLTAKMDSPDQGAKNIPVSNVIVKGDSVVFQVAAVRGSYRGEFESNELIKGNWSQSGMTFPLELKRTEKEFELNRPQEPEKPYPYLEEEVTYFNATDSIELAGTLTMPKSDAPFPAAILISGSGAQNRNAEIFGHKPFLVLADHLTRNGIAVLRVDDRGVGGSEGNIATSTSSDFASDVMAGIQFLKSRENINSSQIGLIGHSEGGIIAPIVANRMDDVDFIVLMAGTGLPGEDILYLQGELIFRAIGVDEETIEKNKRRHEKIFHELKTEKNDSLAKKKIIQIIKNSLDDMAEAEKQATGISDKNIEQQVEGLVSPWFRYFLTFDPRNVLKQVTCPVLAIIGEKDLQVPPEDNLQEIERALKEAGNQNVTVKMLPGLNHLFQTAGTGAPSEYGKIEETMSPVALELISDWILKQVN